MEKYSTNCIAIADVIKAHSKDVNSSLQMTFWYAHITMMNVAIAAGLITSYEYDVLDRYNDIMFPNRNSANQVSVF